MKKIHRKIIFVILFIFSAAFIPAENKTSQNLFHELSFAYSSGFYPGAVQYAEKLLSEYPDSVFSGRAALYEGESLYHLNRSKEAVTVLEKAEKLNADSPEMLGKIRYWLGMSFYSEKKFSESCSRLYESLSFTKDNAEYRAYYTSSVLYAGKSCYEIKAYEKSIPCFIFVMENASSYSKKDYEGAFVPFFDALKKTDRFSEIVKYYKALPAENVSDAVYNVLTLYAGSASEILGKYKEAYNLYCDVLGKAESELAAKALADAYRVSSLHKKEVGEEPGAVLAQTEQKLNEYPDMLAEFWTRLGIDAFDSGDYTKAKTYFYSSDENASRDLLQINALYQAEIMLKTGSSAAATESYLKKAAESTFLIRADTVSSAYSAFLARCAGLQRNWNECISYSGYVLEPDSGSVYWNAIAEYNLDNYEKTVAVIEKYISTRGDLSSPELQRLYARALVKTDRITDALAVYSSMPKNEISDTARLDYAETLLLAGKLSSAYTAAVSCPLPQAKYIAALSAFNRKQWQDAELLFSSFLKEADTKKDAVYTAYSLFYRGYARYQQENFQSAYTDFVNFADKNPLSELVWNARITAANAAVQIKDFKNAVKQAQKAVTTASSQSQVQESVLLCAGIYADSKDYAKAISVLDPYTNLKNDFGLKSLYQKALILEDQGEINQSDKTFELITENFEGQPLSEESRYRRGELYYSVGDYNTAIVRFKSYLSEYPQGKFIDAAMYFIGDSLIRTGYESRAILQYEALLKLSPDSPYIYSTMNKLVTLYASVGDYSSALETARAVQRKYSDQAEKDGIAAKIQELEDLNSGIDKKTAARKQAYEKAGKSSTAKGRHEGTVLAGLYYTSLPMRKQAVELAEELYAIQKKNIPAESADAAANALLLAKWYRTEEKNTESARKYLEAAQYFRMNNNDAEAAVSLYGAVESFDAAQMYADSNDAAATLESLYPHTREAAAAKAITDEH